MALLYFNNVFKLLINDVGEARKPHIDSCFSAQEEVNLQELLKKIVDEETYKRDYNTITAALIFDSVPYDEAIHTLQIIIDTGIFKK